MHNPDPSDPSASVIERESAWYLWQGDAWDYRKQLGRESVDLILTSPPYWGLRTYGLDHDEGILAAWTATQPSEEIPPYEWYRDNGGVLGLEPYPTWFVAHLAEILDAFASALRSGGSMWVNLGDTYFGRWASIRDDGRQGLGKEARRRRRTPSGGTLHDKQMLLIPARFAIAMQDRGWILRNDLVWSKPNVAPRPEKDRLRLTHEHFFHFVKRSRQGRPSYFYDLQEVEEGARDVVVVPTSRGEGGHSATFPAELIDPRIRSSSPEGGIVFDPFCGTGSTLVSALRNKRRAIGVELSPDFEAVARARLAQESSLATMEG